MSIWAYSKELSSYHRKRVYVDKWLLFSVISIVLLGLLMVASSSMEVAQKQFGNTFYFISRQLIFTSLGVGMTLLMLQIPTDFLQKSSRFLLLISIIALIMVLVPGISREVNGSSRWIGIGSLGIQVSEVAKLSLVIYLASYLQRYQLALRTTVASFIKVMLLLSIMAILLLCEPDFGATVVITITTLGMMFLAGVKLRHFAILMILIILSLALLAITSPYRVQRLTAFINPWANQYGSGYQLTQSLIAFGRGGLLGVGLGNSLQKLFYLPEAHTDFLFAVLAEELGLFGIVAVMGLYTIFISRIFCLARRAYNAHRVFVSLLSYGIGFWLSCQVMINIGVSSGALPTKGLTLPYMSYGGSSLLINFIVLGIVMRINSELHQDYH